jgi:sterol desaturase/sphingolipid hydroxylase (fatty acid hydroxylase superfamily)
MSEINFETKNKEKKHEKKPAFETKKDLAMYYQTSLRNVFLSTAVSFAALGYSRFYRGKSKLYSVGMVLVSTLLVICSLLLNLYLYNHINEYMKKLDFMELSKWLNINRIAILIHIIILIFVIYTFYRLYFNKHFSNSS